MDQSNKSRTTYTVQNKDSIITKARHIAGLFFTRYLHYYNLTFYHKYIQEAKKIPMENKIICPHPFYSDDRIETKVLQELCNLGILDERHAILCYHDSATIHIGYLDVEKIDPLYIPFFEGGYLQIYLYADKHPIRYHTDITTLKDMELIALVYRNWGALVTVLMTSVSNEIPTIYERAKANVEKWIETHETK